MVARGFLQVGALAVAALIAAPGAEAAVECGDTITQDRTLKADLVDCPGTGLFIDGNGITLDMNGHAIRGTVDRGMEVAEGSNRVTVRDGSIRNAGSWGLFAGLGDDLKLLNITVANPGSRGIQVNDSTSPTLRRITVSGAAGTSVYFSGVNHGAITDSLVKQAEETGVDFSGVDDVEVSNSRLLGTDASAQGIVLYSGASNRFTDLEIEGWGSNGFAYLGDDPQNKVRRVTSSHNAGGFVVDGSGLVLRDVVARRSGDDGLLVLDTASAVKVVDSVFNRNNDEGIQYLDGATGSLGGNRANDNDDTGILVPATGVTDLGGNSASGNGIANCVNISC